MKRIVIIGNRGSGKTTLALKLSSILNLEIIHLDVFLFNKGWIPKSQSECVSIVENLVKKKTWIMEGHADYKCLKGTYDIRFKAADTIILLELPLLICLWRVLKRTFKSKFKKMRRPEFPGDYSEKYRAGFFRRLLNYSIVEKPIILEKLKRHSIHKRIIILNSSKDVSKFLFDVIKI